MKRLFITIGELLLAERIKREIEAYKKQPVKRDEFGPLISLQEFPS
jgi:hypothetical protein